jgi:hypothetical protein
MPWEHLGTVPPEPSSHGILLGETLIRNDRQLLDRSAPLLHRPGLLNDLRYRCTIADKIRHWVARLSVVLQLVSSCEV